MEHEHKGSGNSYVLPASILIAAVLISGSVVYAFGNQGSSSGVKKYPKNAFVQCLDTNKYASLIEEDNEGANAVGVSGTPATFVNGQLVVGAQPASVFKTVIEAALAGNPAPEDPQKGIGPVNPEVKITERDVILGDPNAPVTVIEYGDYRCSYCVRFFKDAEVFIKENYVQSGKVKMVFRNYAFLGPESVEAAKAAECAKDQGKFWAFHDELYKAVEAGAEKLDKDLFVKISEDLKLNAKK